MSAESLSGNLRGVRTVIKLSPSFLLYIVIAATDSETSLRETGRILGNLLWKDHYIFNLGHGVLPETVAQ